MGGGRGVRGFTRGEGVFLGGFNKFEGSLWFYGQGGTVVSLLDAAPSIRLGFSFGLVRNIEVKAPRTFFLSGDRLFETGV